ncbi:Swt1 family HEPN domain-containing protein [Candidatus Spongiihabitans sp.]|uniref:Swt1 family HEPN domain-containing protein n=1 Tax=Candidatus Spongiihabitans sp. TaxID=3101308 RepID=UPI003C7E1C92
MFKPMAYDKAYYRNLIDAFRPDQPKAVVIAESPPASGKFFYDSQGAADETLFATLMRAFMRREYDTKQAGLWDFQQAGYLLLDATYTPVNQLPPERKDEIIIRDLPLLLSDFEYYGVSKETPIILMKKGTVCRLLEPKLKNNGYNIVGCVGFPRYKTEPYYHKVEKEIQAIRKRENLLPTRNKELENEVRQFLDDANPVIAKFLSEALPEIEKDWWQKCVLESVSADATRNIKDGGHTTLEDLDLSALLQVLLHNWKRIARKRSLHRQDQGYIEVLKGVRNRWSHLSSIGTEI